MPPSTPLPPPLTANTGTRALGKRKIKKAELGEQMEVETGKQCRIDEDKIMAVAGVQPR
jgi:hypothetical protein